MWSGIREQISPAILAAATLLICVGHHAAHLRRMAAATRRQTGDPAVTRPVLVIFRGLPGSGKSTLAAAATARKNLKLGNSVVANSVNPLVITHEMWR